ncbi:hypothetical protein KX971_004423 [Salmonella enterica]|nr:hypothetical protein [Salmonella enterica]
MSKNFLLPVIFSSLFLYSSIAAACPYDYGYSGSSRSGYSGDYAKLAREFEEKRYELNKLYDAGVSETDEKAKVLIKDLDSLSTKIQKERESTRPYQGNRHRDWVRNDYDHCW